MRLLSSLRRRIFLATALLAVLAIATALYVVNGRVTAEAERTLHRELVSTAALVDQLRAVRSDTFTQIARFIADAPRLKAAVDTNDPPTVQDVADGYQHQLRLQSNLLLVTNKAGEPLASVGAPRVAAAIVAREPAIREALAGQESVNLLPQSDGVLQVVTVPITIGLSRPEILGTLSAGFLLDNSLAAQLKQLTGSEVVFATDGRVLAGTLPPEAAPTLAQSLSTPGITNLRFGGQDYLALPQPLTAGDRRAARTNGPVVLILRSRTEQLRFLETIRSGLAATAIVAVVIATLLSFTVARTITRPLAAIIDVMREVAATGDLTRKIAAGSRWDDEDARLLATTFNTLTDSVSRFQREISQKERLTSLGRLSTVIAHEIRNPLMIIKASLHGLTQPGVTSEAVHEAVKDINEEVARLNRIVNEVLDFSRPIHFELAPTDLNALCRDSAAASEKGLPGASVHLELDPAMPAITTDAERLRIALVNLLGNARHAVNGAALSPAAPPLVTLRTEATDGHAAIHIGDLGGGINPGDLAHIFDPYFTTRRGGTGLGLPIARTIVEGLGGTLSVSSVVGRGTDIRIDFPLTPTAPAVP